MAIGIADTGSHNNNNNNSWAYLQPEFVVLQVDQSMRGEKCSHPVRAQRQRLDRLFGRAQHLHHSQVESHALYNRVETCIDMNRDMLKPKIS